MIWQITDGAERLHLWKVMRQEIISAPLNEKLERIARFCSKMPFGSCSIDYYSPSDWPTPWEILYHGSLCTSSISLFMAYTMLLVGIEDVELCLVEDTDGIYLLPLVDKQHILNYQIGSVNNYLEVSNNFKVLQKYSKEQITIK